VTPIHAGVFLLWSHLLLAGALPVWAEPPLTSPYVEQRGSEVRGLTKTEIDDLREGRGMGLARAAELNGYPGPRHLLDAVKAGQIHLTPEQMAAVQRLFETMASEARRLGETILAEERALEAAFRTGTISEPDLRARVETLSALYARLRVVHLRTHLETRALLTEHQIQRYNQLRGYSQPEGSQGQHRH
jgi:hypothetical protein